MKIVNHDEYTLEFFRVFGIRENNNSTNYLLINILIRKMKSQ